MTQLLKNDVSDVGFRLCTNDQRVDEEVRTQFATVTFSTSLPFCHCVRWPQYDSIVSSGIMQSEITTFFDEQTSVPSALTPFERNGNVFFTYVSALRDEQYLGNCSIWLIALFSQRLGRL